MKYLHFGKWKTRPYGEPAPRDVHVPLRAWQQVLKDLGVNTPSESSGQKQLQSIRKKSKA